MREGWSGRGGRAGRQAEGERAEEVEGEQRMDGRGGNDGGEPTINQRETHVQLTRRGHEARSETRKG